MSKLAESTALPARIFRAVMAVLLCVGLMVPAIPVSQASAAEADSKQIALREAYEEWYNDPDVEEVCLDTYTHGDVDVSSDAAKDGVIDLKVGETAVVTVTPYQHVQWVGCCMEGKCPFDCEEYAPGACFTKGKGCSCDKASYLDTSTVTDEETVDGVVSVSKVAADKEISASDAVGTTNKGAVTITAEKAGTTKVTIETDDLLFWKDGEATYTVNVTDSDPVEPGTPELVEGYYQIDSATDLQWFADYVNEGNLDASAKVTADIALEDGMLPGIGSSKTNSFTGAIDGDGHTISGVTSFADASHPGLVGYLGDGGAIKNLTLAGSAKLTASGGAFVANLLGGTIENCVNEVSLTSSKSVGGFVGMKTASDVQASITGCVNKANITATGATAYTGGIIGGWTTRTLEISGCYNEGDISGKYATGGIAGKASSNPSGLIDSCCNKGTITATGKSAGGIVGVSDGRCVDVSNCYNVGEIVASLDSCTVGGIFGTINGTRSLSLSNSFSTGTITGTGEVGAVIGKCTNVPTLANVYYLDSSCAVAIGGEDQPETAPIVKTADEMKSADMAAALGSAFKQGAEHPILAWRPDEAVTPAAEGAKIVADQKFGLRATDGAGRDVSVDLSDLPEGWAGAVTKVTVTPYDNDGQIQSDQAQELESTQYTIDAGANVLTIHRTGDSPVISPRAGDTIEGKGLEIPGMWGSTTYPNAKRYQITISADGFADTVGTIDAGTLYSDTLDVKLNGESQRVFSAEEISEQGTFQNGSSQCGMTGFRTFSGAGVTVRDLLEQSGITLEPGDTITFECTDDFNKTFTYDELFGTDRYFLQCAYDDEEVKEVYDRVSSAEGDAATGASTELRQILAEKALEDGSTVEPMISTHYSETLLSGENVGTTAVPTEDNTEIDELVSLENQFRFFFGIALVDSATVSFETGEGSDVATQTVKTAPMTSTENTTINSKYWVKGIDVEKDAYEPAADPTAADKLTEPDVPTRDGYTFAGWWTEDGSESGDWGEQFDFTSDTVTANTTLYAKWTKAAADPAGAKVVEGQQVQLRQSGETGSARVSISDLPEGWADAVTSVSVKAVNGNDAGTVTELKSDQYSIDTENSRVVFNRTEEAPVFSVAVGEGEELTVSGWRGDTVYPQSKVYEITIKADGFADTVGTVTFYTGASETFYVAVDENKNGKVDEGEVKKTFTQKEIEEMATFQNGSSQCGMTGFRTFSAVGVPVSALLEKAGVEVDANDKFKLDTTDNFGAEFTYDQLFGERYFLQCAYDDEEVKEVYDRVSQAEGDATTGANVELRRILAEKALEDDTRSYPMISANYAETMLDGENVGTTAVPTEDNTEIDQLVGAENQYRFTYGIALVQEDCDVTFETGEGSDVATQTVKSHLMTSTENTTIKSTYWNNGIIITPDAAEAEQPSTAADKLTQPEDPTRDGYTFAGWWTEDGSESGDWGEQFDFTANDGTVDSDTTLYAKWVANDQVMENTDATVSAYREAKYGTPPNGEATTDGQHLQISILFDGAVAVTDEEALLNSLNCKLSGDYALESAKADGNKLILEATGTMLPGGQTKVSAKAESGVIEGVTVDGKAAKLKPIDTIADTGLAFEVVEAVAGTETTPASTTFKVTHSANVRSMNNVLWLTNGGTDETGHDIFGGADWKPAHHHMYWQFDLNTSADFIRQGSETALDEAGYTLTVSGENGEFTVTAKTPKAGEVLSAVVYNDSFLHEYGLANGQAVTGIEMPEAKTTVDLGMSFPTEPEYVSTDMGRNPAGKVDFSLTPSEGALDAYKQARSEATVQTMLQDWIDSISSVTVDGKKLTGKAFDEWKSELTNARDDAGKLNYYELAAGAKAATLTLPIALFDTTKAETATAKVVIESDGFATVSGEVTYRNIGAEDLVVRILDENGKVARTSVLKASDLRKLDVQEHYNTSANCGMAGLRSYNSEGVLLTDVLEAAGVNFCEGMTLKLRTNDSLDSNGTADTTEDGYIFSGTFTYEDLLGTDRYYYPAAWDDTTTYEELDGQTIYDVLSQDMGAWKTDGKYADVLPQLLGQGKQKVEPILAWSWNEGVISWGGSNPAEAEGYNGYSDQESFRFLFGMKAAQDGSITDDNTTFSNTYGVFGIDVIAADTSQADDPNEFKIDYELDGGVNNPDNPTSYEQGTAVKLLDPTREGYTFGGWFMDESFATQITEIPENSSGDVMLYAKWVDKSGEQPGDDPNGQGGDNNNNNQNVNVNVDNGGNGNAAGNGGNGNATDAGKGTAQTGDTMLAVPFACLAGLALVVAAIAALVRRRNGMGDRS